MTGAGLVYFPELLPLFREGTEAVSTLVLEPQTLWEKVYPREGGRPLYRSNDALLAELADLPQRKLLHGVGAPIGGTTDDPLDQVTPLRRAAEMLRPRWVSEHLSFNRVHPPGGAIEDTGFLLPPRQTAEGVALAVENIQRFAAALPLPFACETGVNYLRPRADELPDGEFFAAIAREAPCGIVLDLHNLWANELNGRGSVERVLEALPLDHVWELHLAGGMELDGYWLDAHSSVVPEPVWNVAKELVPRLPNLGAIVFELLPEYIRKLGLPAIRAQLERVRELWALRNVPVEAPARFLPRSACATSRAKSEDVIGWERSLASLLRGDSALPGFEDLARDPGVAILRTLVGEFRRSFVARGCRYTLLFLFKTRGADFVGALLDRYCRATAPDPFAAVECEAFTRFVATHVDGATGASPLAQIVAFESALVRASLRGEEAGVTWSVDPVRLLGSLDEGSAPFVEACGEFTMAVGVAG